MKATKSSLFGPIFSIALSALLILSLGACGFGVGVGVGPSFDPALTDSNSDVESVKEPGKDQAPALSKPYFDAYVLKAVDELYAKYKLLGYDVNSLYTHELPYGASLIKGTPGPKTMCVAAQIEVMLTAMEIYVRETGDKSVYNFLPEQSWKGLTAGDIKGHIWVNSKFNAYGTADALAKFGMGEIVAFEKLRPGAFINFNRTKGNGHAVTFLSFIDKDGKEFQTHNSSIIGFKYFSAQGMHDPGGGGLDFRYAVFSQFGCPETILGKRDCEIIFSANRKVFNAGRMWAPSAWVRKPRVLSTESLGESVFDATYFDGVTTDD